MAVSKTRSAAEVRAAHQCGINDFGENYLQEALPKIRDLQDLSLRWHFIGHIQSNKTRDIAHSFDWVHTLDRLKIARRLNDQRPADLGPLNVCIQVNIDDEDSKSGVAPEETLLLARELIQLPCLKLRGLMAVPAPHSDYQDQLQPCLRMAELLTEIRKEIAEIDTLSLGMSADLEAAIAAGSTMVRVGTDIFGSRK